ncbi:MAG TPA: DUF6011 domain-containing protein [Acidimicrobiales bacterium]|jgi:hypothetical protein
MTLLTPRRAALHARWYRAQGRDDEAQTLEDYNASRGFCKCCGRRLTNPVSVARGIGPECYANRPPPEAA